MQSQDNKDHDQDEIIRRYVDAYCIKHNKAYSEALKDLIVKEYIKDYKERKKG